MDRHIAKVWSLEFPSPTHKFIALCIARMSIKSGLCWAKQKTIAADTGFHVKTVARALGELEELGWIRRQGFLRKNGQRGADHIWLTLPEVVLEADEPDDVSPFDDDAETPARSRALPPGSAGLPSRQPTTPREGAEDSSKSQGTLRESEGEDARDAREPSDDPVDLKLATDVIWQAVGENGRKRSSRPKIEKALGAALKRRPAGLSEEAQLERILRGVRAYLADPDTRKEGGRFEHGAHRTLEGDVWATYLEAAGDPQADDAIDPEMGTTLEPGPKLQRYWAELASQGMPWDSARGPRPEMPGCRISPEIQREFGFTPFVAAGPDQAPDDGIEEALLA